jgi:hypothetical protein
MFKRELKDIFFTSKKIPNLILLAWNILDIELGSDSESGGTSPDKKWCS